jgi:hypothetical protein
MGTKKYSSYEQIELDLEILNIERKINLQKIVLNIHKTKEGLFPLNIIKGVIRDYKSILSNHSGTLLKIAIPLIISWISKRKRGH